MHDGDALSITTPAQPRAIDVASPRHASRWLRRRLPAELGERSFCHAVWLALGVFVVSRLCVAAGAVIRATQVTVDARAQGRDVASATRLLTGVFTDWDGNWYLRIVRLGYPRSVPPGITFHQMEARAAFFPGYPLLVRALDKVLPGGDVFVALGVNVALSVVAIVLLGVLARRIYHDDDVAAKAMMLFAVFPGSFVLSYAYAEPLFIVVSLATLLALHDRHWITAGVFAAVGTACRPNGIALIAACAVAAFIAIRRDRDWRSLVAPVLAPIGVAGFHLYLLFRTGEWKVWFRVQSEAWKEGTSFGLTAVKGTLRFLAHPFESPTDAITAFSCGVLLFMLYCLWKRRLPWPTMAFVAVVVVLMLMPDTVTARPRFVFTAFPLFIAVAAWWPKRDRYVWDLTLLACGAGLAGLTGLYAVYGVIP